MCVEHTYAHTQANTYIRTYIHTYIDTYTDYEGMGAYLSMCIYIYVYTHIHLFVSIRFFHKAPMGPHRDVYPGIHAGLPARRARSPDCRPQLAPKP